MMISDKEVKNKQTKDSNINTHIFMTIFQRVDFVTYRSPFDIKKLFCKKQIGNPIGHSWSAEHMVQWLLF